MLMTIDAGNSLAKIAVWDSGQIVVRHQLVVGADQADLLALFDDAVLAEVSRVVVANVAGVQFERELQLATQQVNMPQPELIEVRRECCGIRHGYRDLSQHGVDRWAAVIAAHQLESGPVCVIDAGSATTFDVVDASGQHRGGCIAPGTRLDREQLMSRFSIDEQLAANLLADNSADGVSAGCSAFEKGGVKAVVLGIQHELGETMSLILTGGAAVSVRAALGDDCKLLEEPDLVMQGLRMYAESAR